MGFYLGLYFIRCATSTSDAMTLAPTTNTTTRTATHSTLNVDPSNCDALNCNVYQFHNSVYKFADISTAFTQVSFELVNEGERERARERGREKTEK